MAKRASRAETTTCALTADELSDLQVEVMVFLRDRGVPAGEAFRVVTEAFAASAAPGRGAVVDLPQLWYEVAYGPVPAEALTKARAA